MVCDLWINQLSNRNSNHSENWVGTIKLSWGAWTHSKIESGFI